MDKPLDKPFPASRDVERAVIGVMINFPDDTIGLVARSGGADLFTLVPYSVMGAVRVRWMG